MAQKFFVFEKRKKRDKSFFSLTKVSSLLFWTPKSSSLALRRDEKTRKRDDVLKKTNFKVSSK